MSNLYLLNHRRYFMRQFAMGAAAFYTVPGVFAQEVSKTPRQTEGPFYPDKLPLDTDNDLLMLNDALTPGVGEITHLTGRVLDVKGMPVRNAVVEIWQCDNNGVYLHSADKANRQNQDKNFQGFGRFLTNAKGEYYFRTIKPVKYPGRSPHIHYAVLQSGKRMLTTQLYIKGDPLNEKDGIYKALGQKEREAVSAAFKPIPDSKIGELSAHFELVIGNTPEDKSKDRFRAPAPR